MTISDLGGLGTGEFNVGQASNPQLIAVKMQAMFMEVMIKTMEESVEADGGLFGSSAGSEIYRGLFREQLATAMSSQLQSPLEMQLRRQLEESSPGVLKVLASSADEEKREEFHPLERNADDNGGLR